MRSASQFITNLCSLILQNQLNGVSHTIYIPFMQDKNLNYFH
jgi:hypothetical protein